MSSRRIPDPGTLIAGIAFAGIGLIFLVGDVELADRARWMWPIVLVGLGAGLLAAVLRRGAEPGTEGSSTFQPSERASLAPSNEPEPGAAAGLPYEPPDEADSARFPRHEDGWTETGATAGTAGEAAPARSEPAADTEVEAGQAEGSTLGHAAAEDGATEVPGRELDAPADERPPGRPGS